MAQSDSSAGITAPKYPPPVADLLSATMISMGTENLEKALLKGGKTCVLKTIDIGWDGCTYNVAGFEVPMFCPRVDMNMPGTIIEGTMRKAHLTTLTGLTALQMTNMMNTKGVAPLGSTMAQDEGEGGLGGISISSSFSRSMAFPPSYNIVYLMALTMTGGNACYAPYINMGMAYNYFSEGDDYGKSSLNKGFLANISPYMTTAYMIPMTTLAKVMEYTGIGGIDVFGIFTFGGFGTVYPVAGVNFTGSVETGMHDTVMDAATINTTTWWGYGPLHLRLGPLHWPLHHETAYLAGVPMLLPQVQQAGETRFQYLYKGPSNAPANECYTTNKVDPKAGVMPAFAAVQTVEKQNPSGRDPVSKSDIAYSFAFYPRVTCCNYCAGSRQAPFRMFLVGRGFWTQLIT